MIVRALEPDDLKDVADWFTDVPWPMPRAERILPQGFIALFPESGLKAACAFVYTTGTSMAYASWLAVNPKVDEVAASDALKEVFLRLQGLCETVKPRINLILMHTKSQALAHALRPLGFRADGGYYQLTWVTPKE